MDKWEHTSSIIAWIATLACSAFASAGWLWSSLAQADPTATTIAGPVTSLGAVGILGWYAWYTNTKTIPETNAFHYKQEQEMLARFDKMTSEQREECRQERATYLASMGRMNDSIDRLANALNQYGFGEQT